MLAAAIYAGAGTLNVAAIGMVAVVAAVAGDHVGFGVGRYGVRRPRPQWRYYVLLTAERRGRAERFFDRHHGGQ